MALLIIEQINPLDLLQPKDELNRHRGANLCGDYRTSTQNKPVIPNVPFIY